MLATALRVVELAAGELAPFTMLLLQRRGHQTQAVVAAARFGVVVHMLPLVLPVGPASSSYRIRNETLMSTSFREDWRVGTALLAALLALGIAGGILIYLFSSAMGADRPARETFSLEEQNITVPVCSDSSETKDRMHSLILVGLDQAFTDHVANLFRVWMSNGTNDPGKAANGIRLGARAYLHARHQIANWDIVNCEVRK
jgi:hypothetical protein